MSKEEIIEAISALRSKGSKSKSKGQQSTKTPKQTKATKPNKKVKENENAEANAASLRTTFQKSKNGKASNRDKSSLEPELHTPPVARVTLEVTREMPSLSEGEEGSDYDEVIPPNFAGGTAGDAEGSNEEDATDKDEEMSEPPTTLKPGKKGRAASKPTNRRKDADKDMEDDENASAGTKRKRNVFTISDDEDTDNGENRDSDCDGLSDNQNTKESSTKRARKGEKANTGPKFSAEASAKSVKKKLGPSRKFLGASPPLSRSASVSSVPPSTASTTSSKSLNSLPPSMKSLVQATKVRFRLHIATTSGFPNLNESVTTAKKLLQDICEERDAEKEWERFKENRSIALSVISLITQCRSNLCNELRKTAQGMVANHFGLSLQMGELELADRVTKLKRNYSYIYAEPLNQNRAPGGVYRNSIIGQIISVQWFAKQNSEADVFIAQGDTMPLQTIALVCTAIHAVLEDWANGKYLPKNNHFEEAKYSGIYNSHLTTLEAFKKASPGAVS
ncbi:hypothetical protein FRC02_003750 [Tulasnella sp. 418]|nr:hypothetical protein FRC02_003750 [Tulasnella sp. 418]